MKHKPKRKSFFSYFNPMQIISFTQRVSYNFGFKFTLLLSSVYYGVKGAGYFYAKETLLPYGQRARLEGQVIQLNHTLSTAPWSIKVVIGVISDSFPLFGYHKKWYMIITCFFGSTACLLLFFLPYSTVQNFELLPGILLFFIHLEGSCHDLLCEGKYVEKMRLLPHTKADVVTYIWFCQGVGNLLAGLTLGALSDYADPRYVYIIAFFCLTQPLIFLFFNCMVNDQVEPHLANKWNTSKWYSEWNMMVLAIILALLVSGTVVMGLVSNTFGRFIFGLIVALNLIILAFMLMPPIIAKANVYIFMARSFYLDISGSMDYFYTEGPDCVIDGSHFSIMFYKTFTTLASAIFSFGGLYLFQLFISRWNFRSAFWFTTILRVLASIFDIILVQRWNRLIGIPDSVVYIVGNTAIVESIYMMDFMPVNLLIAKLCPRDVETTMYSILAGYMNFGTSLSSYIGLYLTELFKIDTLAEQDDGTPCNFDNLIYLILVGHFLLPLIAVPFTFLLIPNARVDDDIITFKEKVLSKTSKKQVF